VKVGLIPPKGLENYGLRSKFHLALALPELIGRRTYGGMYTRAASMGDYVVLDNGIAEGQPCNAEDLATFAAKIGAKEIVAPDVLRNAGKTLALVERYVRDYPPTLYCMAVAQGKKMLEYQTLVEEFAKLDAVTAIGIPRHMLETLDSKACRIDLANWIAEKFPERFDIHFLGTNPYWLLEIKNTSKYAPHVRSVDTSMPFSYAIEGEELRGSRREFTRPDKYFDIDWGTRVNGSLLRGNIATLMEWADAAGTGSDRTVAETSQSAVREVSTQ